MSSKMSASMANIRISRETREFLKRIGRKNETYDDIIRRLVKEAGYNIKKIKDDGAGNMSEGSAIFSS